MTEEIHYPWERQEGENNLWFHRFEEFRLMGNGRSLLGAVNLERVRKGKVGSTCPPGSWRNACDAWHWRARASAWDQHMIDQAAAAIEAKWQVEIMGRTEALGRLSMMGRVNINDFVSLDEDGRITGLKKDALEEFGFLVKKITSSEGRTNSIGIEMYDAKGSIEYIGKVLGLVSDKSTRMNIDLGSLTDAQLKRLAEGEDLIHVLATSG